jgi:hypothetical protein
MKRLLGIVLVAAVMAAPAFAQQNNIGSCGWGSKLFDGQKGVFPQVLAVTTNGTSGNQTFAISSGTSGCTQNGVVTSSWRTAMFIDTNMNRLAKDMSVGEGESLLSLASLIGVTEADRPAFYAQTKASFGTIFPSSKVTSGEVTQALSNVLAASPELAKYSTLG